MNELTSNNVAVNCKQCQNDSMVITDKNKLRINSDRQ